MSNKIMNVNVSGKLNSGGVTDVKDLKKTVLAGTTPGV